MVVPLHVSERQTKTKYCFSNLTNVLVFNLNVKIRKDNYTQYELPCIDVELPLECPSISSIKTNVVIKANNEKIHKIIKHGVHKM